LCPQSLGLYKSFPRRENGCGHGRDLLVFGKVSLAYRRFLGEGKAKMRNLVTALAISFLLCLSTSPSRADGEAAGDFDYYVLALSWSANWCAREGDDRDDPQCDAGQGITWVVHGLWPQYERGWPAFCRTAERDPSRGETAAMADVFGGAGSAFYQWKKHGRCSGLSARDYYSTARAAFKSITLPPIFAGLDQDVRLPALVVEEAFLEVNPGLARDEITITCADGMIQEARICLTKELEPRRCGDDVIRDCRMRDALMEAVR
jgi:ribonuclease T2